MGDHGKTHWPPRRVLDETTRPILVGNRAAAARPPLKGPSAAAVAIPMRGVPDHDRAKGRPVPDRARGQGEYRLTVRETRYNSQNYPIVTATRVDEGFASAAAARAYAKAHFGAVAGESPPNTATRESVPPRGRGSQARRGHVGGLPRQRGRRPRPRFGARRRWDALANRAQRRRLDGARRPARTRRAAIPGPNARSDRPSPTLSRRSGSRLSRARRPPAPAPPGSAASRRSSPDSRLRPRAGSRTAPCGPGCRPGSGSASR